MACEVLKIINKLSPEYIKTLWKYKKHTRKTHKCRAERQAEIPKIVSEYDQEIPQSQTADKPMALRGRATQQSRDTRKTN